MRTIFYWMLCAVAAAGQLRTPADPKAPSGPPAPAPAQATPKPNTPAAGSPGGQPDAQAPAKPPLADAPPQDRPSWPALRTPLVPLKPLAGTPDIIPGVVTWPAAAAQQAAQASPPKPQAPPGPPRVPSTAIELALADCNQLPEAARLTTRYIWLPGGTDKEWGVATGVINFTVNRSAQAVVLRRCGGGALAAVNLAECVDDAKELADLLATWAQLSVSEPYFHVHLPAQRVSVPSYKAADGKTYDFRVQAIDIPSPLLGQAGTALELLLGNADPQFQSACPVVRLDWFLSTALQTVDGGFYYKFRGLKPKTKLGDYWKSRGIDLATIERLNGDDREICLSDVTGQIRGIQCFTGAAVKPSSGSSLMSQSFDYQVDRRTADKDILLSLLDAKPDAREIFVTLPSGYVEYTIFNGAEELIDEAPPNVVTDHKIPAPYPARLQPGISCIRCHGPAQMWKPIPQELKQMLSSHARVLTDFSGGTSLQAQFDAWRKVQLKFSGDFAPAIKLAQDAFDRTTFRSTRLGGKELCEAISEIYQAYNFAPVDAIAATKELGYIVDLNDDPTGAATFGRICPPVDPQGFTADFVFLARLATLTRDPDTAKPKGLALTRSQWELIYQVAWTRTKGGNP